MTLGQSYFPFLRQIQSNRNVLFVLFVAVIKYHGQNDWLKLVWTYSSSEAVHSFRGEMAISNWNRKFRDHILSLTQKSDQKQDDIINSQDCLQQWICCTSWSPITFCPQLETQSSIHEPMEKFLIHYHTDHMTVFLRILRKFHSVLYNVYNNFHFYHCYEIIFLHILASTCYLYPVWK